MTQRKIISKIISGASYRHSPSSLFIAAGKSFVDHFGSTTLYLLYYIHLAEETFFSLHTLWLLFCLCSGQVSPDKVIKTPLTNAGDQKDPSKFISAHHLREAHNTNWRKIDNKKPQKTKTSHKEKRCCDWLIPNRRHSRISYNII